MRFIKKQKQINFHDGRPYHLETNPLINFDLLYDRKVRREGDKTLYVFKINNKITRITSNCNVLWVLLQLYYK